MLTGRQINILNHIKSAHHALRLWNPPSNSTKTCPPRCCQRQPRARGWDRWKPGLWVEVSQTNAGRMAKFGEFVWGNQRMITTIFWLKKAVQLWSGCFLVVVLMCAHVLHRLLETLSKLYPATSPLTLLILIHGTVASFGPRSLHLQPPWFGEGKWWCLSSHLYSVCMSLFIFVLFICTSATFRRLKNSLAQHQIWTSFSQSDQRWLPGAGALVLPGPFGHLPLPKEIHGTSRWLGKAIPWTWLLEDAFSHHCTEVTLWLFNIAMV